MEYNNLSKFEYSIKNTTSVRRSMSLIDLGDNIYSLQLNKFNPSKTDSPNQFLSKLEFRIKHYNSELDNSDLLL